MNYGLVEIRDDKEKTRKRFFIYEGEDPSMKNWIGLVEFRGRDFKIMPFKKNSTIEEQLALCRLCIDKANALNS